MIQRITLLTFLIIPQLAAQNWFPDSVGNKWQYYYTNYFQGLTYRGIDNHSVEKDTTIDGLRYFKITHFNGLYRFDKTNQILYRRYFDSDILFMDFNLSSGQTFSLFIPWWVPQYYTAIVTEALISLWGIDFQVKGFITSYPYFYSAEWAINLGPITNLSEFDSEIVIQAILTNDDSIVVYDHDHFPQIDGFVPINSTDTTYVSWQFFVNHHYSFFPSPGIGSLNHIESIYIEHYYEKGDSSIQIINIFADVSNFTNEINIEYNLDFNLLNNGFDYYYRLVAKDKGIIPHYSFSPDSGFYKMTYDPVTNVVDYVEPVTIDFDLSQNFPNPFNPTTTIEYLIPISGKVTVKVFNPLGVEVATLVEEYRMKGLHSVNFNSDKLTSGIYIYQLKVANYIAAKKMIVLK